MSIVYSVYDFMQSFLLPPTFVFWFCTISFKSKPETKYIVLRLKLVKYKPIMFEMFSLIMIFNLGFSPFFFSLVSVPLLMWLNFVLIWHKSLCYVNRLTLSCSSLIKREFIYFYWIYSRDDPWTNWIIKIQSGWINQFDISLLEIKLWFYLYRTFLYIQFKNIYLILISYSLF
jgi:hypothetical protein